MDLVRLRAELANAARTLEQLSTSPASNQVSIVHRDLCAISSRLQAHLADPEYFLYQLASQNQTLACIKWLGEYQVVACVPLTGSIAVEELADLTDVPASLLSRVVRMTATAGFLQEPEPGYIAHSPLSTPFTTELLYLDAVTCLASKIAPSALQLSSMSPNSGQPEAAAYQMDVNDATAWDQHQLQPESIDQPKARRQWSAFCRSMGAAEGGLNPILNGLNWHSLGQASVVHICPNRSELVDCLAQLAPGIQVLVQKYSPTNHNHTTAATTAPFSSTLPSHHLPRIRRCTDLQPVNDAAVYIIQPDSSSLCLGQYTVHDLVAAELQSHIHVLRSNPSALLILAPPLLPEPGSVPLHIEVQARLRDFSQLQLTKQSALEVLELYKIVGNIVDNSGKLVVLKQLRSGAGEIVALVIRYRSFLDAANGDDGSQDIASRHGRSTSI